MSKADAVECLRQRTGWYDPAVLDCLHAALEVGPQMVLRDFSVAEMTEKLRLLDQAQLKLQAVNLQEIIGRMVLAENIWLPNQQLAISKGHEVNPVILPALWRLGKGRRDPQGRKRFGYLPILRECRPPADPRLAGPVQNCRSRCCPGLFRFLFHSFPWPKRQAEQKKLKQILPADKK